MKKSCFDCRYFDVFRGDPPAGMEVMGYCRKNPPVSLSVGGRTETYWPAVTKREWCGSYEEREAEWISSSIQLNDPRYAPPAELTDMINRSLNHMREIAIAHEFKGRFQVEGETLRWVSEVEDEG